VTQTPFADPAVADVFDAYPDPEKAQLLSLREMIFETAASTPQSGKVLEQLKWGQPSYATVDPVTGTPIRLGIPKKPNGSVALYVHCGTSLIQTYKTHYADTLAFEGKRAVLIDAEDDLPEEAIRHCIALALTYRL